MTGPWWMAPDKVLGPPWMDPAAATGPSPLFPAVKKPERFNKEMLRPPELPELEQIRQQDSIILAYVRGSMAEISAKMERAATEMLTSGLGYGLLVFYRVDGLEVTHRVWLDPQVPFGMTYTWDTTKPGMLMTLEQFTTEVVSADRARLVR